MPASESIERTRRFALRSRIGSGGFGVVYEAFDRERNIRVALKLLRNLNPEALLRFKREYRVLQGIEHPNLVSLGELVEEDGKWFFTMELVEGVDILTWVREDRTRVRDAFAQLASALGALHAAGLVHRDVKPQNVLVTKIGRVVLLDFGFIVDTTASESSDVQVVGTAAFMAPEQAASQPVGPESDLYSVGVMLYQALAGRLPHDGTLLQVLQDKQQVDPPAPSELDPTVPRDLDRLCRDLLVRDRKARPSTEDVIARLGGAVMRPGARVRPPASMFVGREDELRRLTAAFEAARATGPVIAVVRGEAGAGKTTLMRRFLERMEGSKEADLVLAGRCYQRELVHYKAFDGVIDEAARFLSRLPHREAAALLPEHTTLLAEVFPVLRRVESVPQGRGDERTRDPITMRDQVFGAVRELLLRLALTRRTIVSIEDLQWADPDSLALLAEVLRAPDAPRILLLATVAAGGASGEDPVEKLLAGLSCPVVRVDLDPLAADDARELAASLLRTEGAGRDVDPSRIAAESRGNPLFVVELVRHALVEGADDHAPARVEEALWHRIERLPAAARMVLELIAIGARLTRRQLAPAAALSAGELTSALDRLETARLVRPDRDADADPVELMHDRVRDVVMAHLDEARLADHHRALARALEDGGLRDPDVLAFHWLGAGEKERASAYLVQAAERASAALAFDRAARLFQRAIALLGASEERRTVTIKLADALANAGRASEASEAYLDAAWDASTAERIELMRRAAEQLLRAGEHDDGVETLRRVFQELDVRVPSTPRGVLASLVAGRAWLKLRGLSHRTRPAADVRHEDLMRIDACHAAAIGLGMMDTMAAADFQTRHLILALKAGEPTRIARGLASEISFAAVGGASTIKRSEELEARARDLAAETGDAQVAALVTMHSGLAAYLQGRWRLAHRRLAEATAALREAGSGVAFEIANTEFMDLCALAYVGDLRAVSARLPLLIKQATDRGVYMATQLRTWLSHQLYMAGDDPEQGERTVATVMKRWSSSGFHHQHNQAFHARVHLALYRGDAEAAWRLVEETLPALERSLLMKIQLIRLQTFSLRARVAVAMARKTGAASWQKLAERDARRLVASDAPWAAAKGAVVQAGLAALRGERGAARLYERAADAFDAEDMALHGNAARRRAADLRADAKAIAAIDAAFAEQGVLVPAKFAAVYAP